jgi:hypothetical protein
MSPGRVQAIAGTLLGLCLLGSVLLLQQVDTLRPKATLEEALYISSPGVLQHLSLGYSSLLADIYWTRAVQYFGTKHHELAMDYHLLAPLLDITAHLDPHLIVAYQFGSNFLAPAPPNGAGMPERAIELMKFGIQNNPNEWRLYYGLGFIYYMDLQDYPRAADAFSQGARLPDAHPFMKLMAAQMAEHAGETQTARMLWSTTYETSKDYSIRVNALAHLRALQVDDDVTALESAVNAYCQRYGRLPTSMSDLISSHLLPGPPIDPTGRAYRLTANGRIVVQSPDDLPFITKGLPDKYQPPLMPHLNKIQG